jgi:tetratricopeptide (TPR) repeat protein
MNSRLYVLITLILFGGSAVASAQSIKIADSLLTSGKYKNAMGYYEKALKEGADKEKCLRGRGYSEIQIGEYKKGITDYQEALIINPKCINCYINIANAEAIQGNLDAAFTDINKAIAISDTSGDAYIFRAKLETATGKYLDALADFDKAISLKPKNGAYYIERGNYKVQQYFYASGMKDIDEGIRLNPERADFYLAKGDGYNMHSEHEQALECYKTAIRKGYRPSIIYERCAFVEDALKKFGDALADYDTAISRNSTNINAYANRSQILYKLEDLDGTCSDIHKINKLMEAGVVPNDTSMYQYTRNMTNGICDPSRESYYYQRGIAAFNTADFNKSIEYYDKGLEKFPKSSFQHEFKGNALLALNRYSEALGEYYTSLAKIRYAAKELKELGKPYTEQDKNTNLVSIYLSISECRCALGDFTVAQKIIDSVINLKLDLPKKVKSALIAQKAAILRVLKNYDASYLEYSNAIAIDPDPNLFYGRALTLFYKEISRDNHVQALQFHLGYQNGGSFIENGYTSFGNSLQKNNGYDRVIISHAIEDCEKTIELNKDFGYAYLLLGYLKMFDNRQDYCYDVFKARQLNIPEATDFIRKNCK